MHIYRPPNDDERRIIFFYLKQATSLSAWNRVFKHYQEFVRVVEVAFDEASNKQRPGGIYIYETDRDNLQKAERAFKLALERLRDGDRSCFRWAYSPGHFSQGMRYAEIWTERLIRGDEYPVYDSPMWPDVWMALKNTMTAFNAVCDILEPREMDLPAPIERADYHLSGFEGNPFVWLKKQLDLLPKVPRLYPGDPTIIIRTGQTIPISGIWEPCEASSPSSMFRRAFGQTSPLPDDVVVNPEGSMNYLHKGSNAPTIAFPGDTYRREGKPICWCLLWVDERYGKNSIPEEEAMYTYPPLDIYSFPPM